MLNNLTDYSSPFKTGPDPRFILCDLRPRFMGGPYTEDPAWRLDPGRLGVARVEHVWWEVGQSMERHTATMKQASAAFADKYGWGENYSDRPNVTAYVDPTLSSDGGLGKDGKPLAYYASVMVHDMLNGEGPQASYGVRRSDEIRADHPGLQMDDLAVPLHDAYRRWSRRLSLRACVSKLLHLVMVDHLGPWRDSPRHDRTDIRVNGRLWTAEVSDHGWEIRPVEQVTTHDLDAAEVTP